MLLLLSTLVWSVLDTFFSKGGVWGKNQTKWLWSAYILSSPLIFLCLPRCLSCPPISPPGIPPPGMEAVGRGTGWGLTFSGSPQVTPPQPASHTSLLLSKEGLQGKARVHLPSCCNNRSTSLSPSLCQKPIPRPCSFPLPGSIDTLGNLSLFMRFLFLFFKWKYNWLTIYSSQACYIVIPYFYSLQNDHHPMRFLRADFRGSPQENFARSCCVCSGSQAPDPTMIFNRKEDETLMKFGYQLLWVRSPSIIWSTKPAGFLSTQF